jgi:hypothetical protein
MGKRNKSELKKLRRSKNPGAHSKYAAKRQALIAAKKEELKNGRLVDRDNKRNHSGVSR